jgi:deazaflavin-dependent oxidoreductase (nitroreductase family)
VAGGLDVVGVEVEAIRHRRHCCDTGEVEPHFAEPGWFTRNAFNPLIAWLSRHGLSVAGSRVLEVQGRKSGEWRRTPVNPLPYEGELYLVAPRGNTQWVRNLRASGRGRLVGRSTEVFTAIEVDVAERPELLRAYLKKWKWEVGAFFEGVGPESPEEDLARIAPERPVFRISR